MKITKITLVIACAAAFNLCPNSIYALENKQDEQANPTHTPIVTPTEQTIHNVAHGTGRIIEGTGEVITLQPGQGVKDMAEGSGEIVEGALKAPGRFLGIIRD